MIRVNNSNQLDLMHKSTKMKACPKCKSASRRRLKRMSFSFVKFFPGTKSYGCDKCNTRYTWFPLINRSFRV